MSRESLNCCTTVRLQVFDSKRPEECRRRKQESRMCAEQVELVVRSLPGRKAADMLDRIIDILPIAQTAIVRTGFASRSLAPRRVFPKEAAQSAHQALRAYNPMLF